MARFEFVGLECVKQQEPFADEIVIRYGSGQAFPDEGYMKFRKGTVLVNERSGASNAELRPLLGARGAVRVPDYDGVEEFRRREIPVEGLTVRVVEIDWPVSRNDLIGTVFVSAVATDGARTVDLTGAGAHYRLTYRVIDP